MSSDLSHDGDLGFDIGPIGEFEINIDVALLGISRRRYCNDLNAFST